MLSKKIKKIKLKGIKALNAFKTSYEELNALSTYLNFDFFKYENSYFLFKNKTLICKSKEAKKIKAYLVKLLGDKKDKLQEKELKKLSDIRLKELRKMKHNEQIRKANENGLFSYEELAS
ncbi:hypothetical protein K8T27_000922 [Campylobacter upsaliensis]|uniref:Uncharacterized protein n=2 Tax=Campylobacter upsaliensis TaxID=28080 RepID=A0A5L4JW47_CAMUP|nr:MULTISPECIES: hypothetical protein [Campylobacter]EAH7072742.1 hypothetical protein [Campylobacter upsaliensis]EAI0665645.1 hypothetical protein [Campylobacter upsaliensis]EAI0687906.1 hypothetical protein [Campylobacter upsaliensis]EAI2894649.1 hypothetical protein [Campylobacter upsaliensis]EAI3670910.1 hypothetical protein [Campylobacter upsaliensis]